MQILMLVYIHTTHANTYACVYTYDTCEYLCLCIYIRHMRILMLVYIHTTHANAILEKSTYMHTLYLFIYFCRPVTIPAFNIEQWYIKNEKWMENGIDSTTSATPTVNKDDYLEQQKRLLEMFQKNKEEELQQKQIPTQTVKVPNVLVPPQQIQIPPTPQNTTINSIVDTANRPSDDLLCLSANAAPARAPFVSASSFGNQMSAFGMVVCISFSNINVSRDLF